MIFKMGLKLYKIFLHKAYFDKGYSLTNYFFKLIAVMGLTSRMMKATFWILLFYSILCYFLGRYAHFHNWVDTENDVANNFNPFQKEVRHYIKNRNI